MVKKIITKGDLDTLRKVCSEEGTERFKGIFKLREMEKLKCDGTILGVDNVELLVNK